MFVMWFELFCEVVDVLLAVSIGDAARIHGSCPLSAGPLPNMTSLIILVLLLKYHGCYDLIDPFWNNYQVRVLMEEDVLQDTSVIFK